MSHSDRVVAPRNHRATVVRRSTSTAEQIDKDARLLLQPLKFGASVPLVAHVMSFADIHDLLKWRCVCVAWSAAFPLAIDESERRIAALRASQKSRCELFYFPCKRSRAADDRRSDRGDGDGGSGERAPMGSPADEEEDDEAFALASFFSKLHREPAHFLRRKSRDTAGFDVEDRTLLAIYWSSFVRYRLVAMAVVPMLLTVPAFTPLIMRGSFGSFGSETSSTPHIGGGEGGASLPPLPPPISVSLGVLQLSWDIVIGVAIQVASLWVAAFFFCWQWIQATVPESRFSRFLVFCVVMFFSSMGLLITLSHGLHQINASVDFSSSSDGSLLGLLVEACPFFCRALCCHCMVYCCTVAYYVHHHYKRYRGTLERAAREQWRHSCILHAVHAVRSAIPIAPRTVN